jgi:hypothetical protein
MRLTCSRDCFWFTQCLQPSSTNTPCHTFHDIEKADPTQKPWFMSDYMFYESLWMAVEVRDSGLELWHEYLYARYYATEWRKRMGLRPAV